MTQLVHESEGLLRFPRLLLNQNYRTCGVVKCEAEDRVFFGNLPLSVVTVATKDEHAASFHGRAVAIKAVLLSKTEPFSGNTCRVAQISFRKLWWVELRLISILEIFAKAEVDVALFFDSFDQRFELRRELRLLISKRSKLGSMRL